MLRETSFKSFRGSKDMPFPSLIKTSSERCRWCRSGAGWPTTAGNPEKPWKKTTPRKIPRIPWKLHQSLWKFPKNLWKKIENRIQVISINFSIQRVLVAQFLELLELYLNFVLTWNIPKKSVWSWMYLRFFTLGIWNNIVLNCTSTCWMKIWRYINKFQIYDATTVLCIGVSCIERGTGCLLI